MERRNKRKTTWKTLKGKERIQWERRKRRERLRRKSNSPLWYKRRLDRFFSLSLSTYLTSHFHFLIEQPTLLSIHLPLCYGHSPLVATRPAGGVWCCHALAVPFNPSLAKRLLSLWHSFLLFFNHPTNIHIHTWPAHMPHQIRTTSYFISSSQSLVPIYWRTVPRREACDPQDPRGETCSCFAKSPGMHRWHGGASW